MIEYIYLKSETLNGIINSDRLFKEISESSISVKVDKIEVFSDDFKITFKQDMLSNQKSMLDSIVSNHTGDDLEYFEQKITYDGSALVSQTFGVSLEQCGVWKCMKFESIPEQTTFFDVKITDEKKLQGGSYYIINNDDIDERDYVEFSYIDIDNILGYHTLYGLPNGYPIELKKIVYKEYLKDEKERWFMDDKFYYPLTSGLYMRISFVSNGNIPIRFKVRFKFFE